MASKNIKEEEKMRCEQWSSKLLASLAAVRAGLPEIFFPSYIGQPLPGSDEFLDLPLGVWKSREE